MYEFLPRVVRGFKRKSGRSTGEARSAAEHKRGEGGEIEGKREERGARAKLTY